MQGILCLTLNSPSLQTTWYNIMNTNYFLVHHSQLSLMTKRSLHLYPRKLQPIRAQHLPQQPITEQILHFLSTNQNPTIHSPKLLLKRLDLFSVLSKRKEINKVFLNVHFQRGDFFVKYMLGQVILGYVPAGLRDRKCRHPASVRNRGKYNYSTLIFKMSSEGFQGLIGSLRKKLLVINITYESYYHCIIYFNVKIHKSKMLGAEYRWSGNKEGE